jgi:hypothetical protein
VLFDAVQNFSPASFTGGCQVDGFFQYRFFPNPKRLSVVFMADSGSAQINISVKYTGDGVFACRLKLRFNRQHFGNTFNQVINKVPVLYDIPVHACGFAHFDNIIIVMP